MSHSYLPKKPGDRLPLMADDLLVQQALAGDQGAFEALVHKYERPLRGYLWNILKEDELIADVLQQVFLQLSVWLPKLSTNRSLKAWLFRVAYYRCLDELRKKQRRQVIFFSQLEGQDSEEEPPFVETIPDGQPMPEDLLEQQELHEHVMHALRVLSPRARSIVHLRCFRNLTFSEIGEHLNISENTARISFHRSLPRLRAVF
ncbi:DNA-directed RNA polymerase sigma-70 factor [Reticulibacter mediterranei]|uniref:DNA-directed RNA polymerase sigma-70 factor n=1 Tax=Reticulibacter mediterranei TaxID=2778369 RepID=A0A8J3N5J3_9CHLR|nr:sigma-70 family RNA polymerase sigma factor [Reticulibacter mediterranei]GHO96445.1 DNA-directed RNA polymerase sigma-70 factor [Reticulibacter mediterranei]